MKLKSTIKTGLMLLLAVCLAFTPLTEALPARAADSDLAYELSGIAENRDLLWLKSYISAKEDQWESIQRSKMTAAGIPEERTSFAKRDGHELMFKQMLCMMAVHRNYAFYNRVICMWYIDNLYQEMHTYEISGPAAVGGAMKGGLPVLNLIKALVFGGQWNDTVSSWLSAKQRTATVCGFRSLEEMFAIDQFTTRVPVYFEGWNEEKQAECRELMALDDETLLATLAARQRGSLLDSPAPMYKQGAAEWAGERFGGGTMASDACCPTAIATVLSGLLEQRITPLEIANKYDTDLYRDPSSGSYGGRMCEAAGNDFGIAHEAGRGELSSAEIREALATGAMIVMSMQPSAPGGTYATVYHYVALVGLTGAGQVIVNNPGINGDVTYDDMSTILNNQSGRGYGIFFPTQGAYLAYEAQMHPAAQETEAE